MKNVLASENRPALAALAESNALLAFDYDGTLAPIVPDPEQAWMRPQTRELLHEVTKRYRVIVISGRAQPDVMKKVRGVGIFETVGNHGIEPRHSSDRYVETVQAWLPVLQEAVASAVGVTIENKIYSMAIHYRHAPEREKARRAIMKVAQKLGDVRIIRGKLVVNVVPAGAPDKGTALKRERDRLHYDKVLYVGDDETDEDVFALSEPWLLSIRVGAKRSSAAPYCIADQRAIDTLLRVLASYRTPEAMKVVAACP
ncbi:MAG: trehalose-phosphatase [Polyangiaceae bacterium]|nr:trehalose-phosphatase [Polyangiaceae bacterium]